MSLNWNGKKPVVDCSKDKGFTVQADRDEADINKIIARLEKGGTMARMNSKEPFYGDVSNLGGLQEALMKVQKANELFMDFDAKIREKFDNDPVKFVQFLDNPENKDEAIDLGIIKPLPPTVEVAKAPSPVPEPGK